MKQLKLVLMLLLACVCACGFSVESKERVVAYVTSWTDVTPDPQYMTNINYAFGHVNDTFDGVRIDNPERFRQIAALKKDNPALEVQLSVGGWGSGRFSEMAASDSLRARFAADCRRVMEEYDLDGIDIDWEYPGVDAAGISASPHDKENFTLLMRDLRNVLPDSALLTIATVSTAQYIDLPAVMPYVDFVNIMAYDMASAPKHHSPLYSTPITGEYSSDTAVTAHLKAGVPPQKLTLGLPFYGHGRDPYDDFVNWNEITLKPGCRYMRDSVACAPYIVDAAGEMVLGYEDTISIAAKCEYIRNHGLLGAMYWEYGADDAQNTLAKAVAANMLQPKYPANYAREPRFNALIYYSEHAEEAHVQFAQQAIEYIHKLSFGEGFTYKVTTDFGKYKDRLGQFDVIVALNVMPSDPDERAAFERYMENGGGWVGFHGAGYNDVRTGWPWFNNFLGAGHFYCNNWPPQPALLEVDTPYHPVTRSLPPLFVAPESEWYQWDPSPRQNPDVEVLLTLSPRNYPLGIKDVVNFGDFPVVWTNRKFRMIYLNMGHGDTEFTDATQNLLFVNALRWVVSRSPGGNPFSK